MHVVVEMRQFVADVKSAHLTEPERTAIVNRIAAAPASGDLVQGIGGARARSGSPGGARARAVAIA